ncbi:UNVERIFIED_CONTAM: hypothetical protein K2H54_012558, partial [Gekko kuhli]
PNSWRDMGVLGLAGCHGYASLKAGCAVQKQAEKQSRGSECQEISQGFQEQGAEAGSRDEVRDCTVASTSKQVSVVAYDRMM